MEYSLGPGQSPFDKMGFISELSFPAPFSKAQSMNWTFETRASIPFRNEKVTKSEDGLAPLANLHSWKDRFCPPSQSKATAEVSPTNLSPSEVNPVVPPVPKPVARELV